MARIELSNVHKRYGQGPSAHQALAEVSLAVEPGEFLALLGPSGSGKTSLLRAIAGLERIDDGRILIGERCVAEAGRHVPPERRNVGVVFQSHALWPHLSVFENVAFPLREASLKAAEIHQRTRMALEQVGLDALQARMPGELSGGQKQRVSLARALVAQPGVILFDEPLASLDVELRRGLMRHISQVRSAHNTMVYVTHNQEEALGLADRIALLFDGRIEQLDTPMTLCHEPATPRVAAFMGHGNLLEAISLGAAGEGRCRVRIGDTEWGARCHAPKPQGSPVRLAVSASAFEVVAETEPGLPAWVEHVFFQGLDGYSVDARLQTTSGSTAIQLNLPLQARPQTGQTLRLGLRDAWVLPRG